MTEHLTGRVVAGVDGSPASRAAADFAAEEALAHRVPLHLVCAHSMVGAPASMSPASLPPLAVDVLQLPEPSEPDPETSSMLSGVVEHLRHAYPGLDVDALAVAGRPSAVLVEESRSAGLLIVGARGHGGFSELLVGSTATQVATHAHCPVIVVRGTSRATGPVVVGVDTAHHPDVVCRFAFAEAAWRDVPLLAVHAWAPGIDQVAEAPEAHRHAQQLLTDTLATWREKYPQVTVEGPLLSAADPADILAEISLGASLVVVGSHGRGRFTSLLLGSVSSTVIHHAHCPVAVVRADA